MDTVAQHIHGNPDSSESRCTDTSSPARPESPSPLPSKDGPAESDTPTPGIPPAPSRPKKKPRTETDTQSGTPPSCYLVTLPLELVAEVLQYVVSPRDVLALARCSRYFCDTLVGNPSAEFIWRRAREACLPYALPAPPPNFSEAAFAAFVFDGGVCEMCDEQTNAMYESFALRLRLCGKPNCRAQMHKKMVTSAKPAIRLWMIPTESDRCLNINTTAHSENWPGGRARYRETDRDEATREYTDAQSSPALLKAYAEKYKPQAIRLQILMPIFVALSEWKYERQTFFQSVKTDNEYTAKRYALKEGWDYWALMTTRTYSELHRLRGINCEHVSQADFNRIRTQVEAEILENAARKKRRKDEEAYRQYRTAVEKHYLRLRSARTQVLPGLAEFRRLPVIQVLRTETGPQTTLSEELQQSPLLAGLLRGDLERWHESAREGLAGVLGLAGWRSASSLLLHPVERLTARFRCVRCEAAGNGECLDYEGACAHQCGHLDKRERAKDVWSAEGFVKDEKAVAVAEQMLALCGAKAEERESLAAVRKLGLVMCGACEGAIIMSPDNVIPHAARHEKMNIRAGAPGEMARVLRYPLEEGLYARVMGKGKEAKAVRELTIYGCRHCEQVREGEEATSTEGAGSGDQGGTGVPEPSKPGPTAVNSNDGVVTRNTKSKPKAPKYFNFNGLRSHAKTKHSIQTLLDEDFFCDREEEERLRPREKSVEEAGVGSAQGVQSRLSGQGSTVS